MKNNLKYYIPILAVSFFLTGWMFNQTVGQKSLPSEILNNGQIKASGNGNSGNYITSNQRKIDILNYLLNIDLNTHNKILKGDVTLSGLVKDTSLKQIDLNFYDNLKISKLLFNGSQVNFEDKGTTLSIFPAGQIPDTFKVRIIYEGTPKRLGFSSFVFGEINGLSCVYNLSEPDYASTWFPCNDLPDDKATYEINITNDSSCISASNGILTGVTTIGDRRTYRWKTSYPTSTYLVCIYSSHYINFSGKYISQDKVDTMAIQYYAFPNQVENAKKDFSVYPEMIDFLAKTFGEYPFIKEKFGAAEFLWQMGAMETQTLIGIGSNFIGGNQFFNDILVHELAHHWFGDAVGPKSWKDVWLNEGFASYCEALYAEHKGGRGALQSVMMNKFSSAFKGTLYDPQNLFGSTVYDKGAWVLNMLRHQVGDSVFFRIMRKYFKTYEYKNASTADFKKICEEVSQKNLNRFFDEWVYKGTGILEVNFDWKTTEAGGNYNTILNINQSQRGYDTYEFPLDVETDYDDNTHSVKTFWIDSRQKVLKIISSKKPVNIKLDPDNWLLAAIPGT